jgi:hypothetical protein
MVLSDFPNLIRNHLHYIYKLHKFSRWQDYNTLTVTGYRLRLQSLQTRGPLFSTCQWHITYSYIVVCLLLGNSPASEFYMPTFRNTLFHLHRQMMYNDYNIFINCNWVVTRWQYPRARGLHVSRYPFTTCFVTGPTPTLSLSFQLA